jgi:hypothetical protein
MKPVTCRGCIFWQHVEFTIGRCRRFPPRALPKESDDARSVWSETYQDDWCGEHKPMNTPEPFVS